MRIAEHPALTPQVIADAPAPLISTSGPVEPCEGGCGSKVFTVYPATRRPELREVAKRGSIEHTAQRCRDLRTKLAAKEAEKAEAKNVIRHFQRYTAEQRANHAASHRLGHRQRESIGEYLYIHPACPGLAFSTRGEAARAALRRAA